MKCPTCGCSRRGTQAPATRMRVYVCEVCHKECLQYGPGRPRRICPAKVCQRKAQQRRRLL